MRLLILTQKVDQNDDVLGFFHRWIEEFAKYTDRVTVIALGVGEHHLPDNVHVFSLGKEQQLRKRSDLENLGLRSVLGEQLRRVRYILNFYRLIWRERKNYDVVFVHMNQIYVLLGWVLWKILRKPVGLWYVHQAKTLSLWLAEKFVDVVFTSRKEGFTIATNKSMYLGHGIDVRVTTRPREHFVPRDDHAILCVGRLTPIKDQKTIIKACGILSREGIPFTCTFIGGPAAKGDKEYEDDLQRLVLSNGLEGKVFFKGGMPQEYLFPYYWQSDLHINACPAGGLDKVVIEGMLGGAIPLVANESFRGIFGEYADRLIFRHGDAKSLAGYIKNIFESDDRENIRMVLEKRSRELFDLSVLVKKIINWYETSR